MSEQISSLAYRQFVDTCRSPFTRETYIKALGYFMDYLRLSPEAYDKLLEKDPKIIQMDVCDYISHLRLRKKYAPATVSLYTAAVSKFYAMNDIQLNWKKIHSFQGEHEKQVEDRPYVHSEIHTLIQKASLRNRCIILLMSSAGPRVGAIPPLRIKDLEPIDKYQIYKITFYAQSNKKSRYFSFCTVECRKEIDAYLEWRRRWNERLHEDSPLFRRDYNPNPKEEKSAKVKPITRNAIIHFMASLLKDTGLRTITTLE